MYIIDYKKKAVAKFNKSDLAFFLNKKYQKNRFIFCDNKLNAKKIIRFVLNKQKIVC